MKDANHKEEYLGLMRESKQKRGIGRLRGRSLPGIGAEIASYLGAIEVSSLMRRRRRIQSPNFHADSLELSEQGSLVSDSSSTCDEADFDGHEDDESVSAFEQDDEPVFVRRVTSSAPLLKRKGPVAPYVPFPSPY
jgi:hypothetical protein